MAFFWEGILALIFFVYESCFHHLPVGIHFPICFVAITPIHLDSASSFSLSMMQNKK